MNVVITINDEYYLIWVSLSLWGMLLIVHQNYIEKEVVIRKDFVLAGQKLNRASIMAALRSY